MANTSQAGQGGHEAYFLGFSGYSAPLVPQYPVSKAEAQKHRGYIRVEYDAAGHIIVLEKILDGKVDFRDDYRYYPNGKIREVRTSRSDGRVTTTTFDESGNPLKAR